tara:strand:+ start:9484 stop:9945 length:462 start_codon:yes stop_codon:yes gene_type:complete
MAQNRKLQDLIEDKYIKDDQIQLEAHIKPRTVVTTSGQQYIPIMLEIVTAAGAAANLDTTIQEKMVVTDVHVIMTGAGASSDTVRVTNGTGSDHITAALDVSGSAGDIVRAGNLTTANITLAAGATLRVTTVDGDTGNDLNPMIVIVQGYKGA